MFITFEGCEGSGKSTHTKALYQHLIQMNIPTVLAHEPGGTALGDKIDQWVKHGEKLSPETELLLFAASRAQLLTELVRPSLEEGKVVICDRYSESTLSYQGYGRGISLNIINSVNSIATEGLRPNLIILLDIDPVEGLARKSGSEGDHFERETIAFHHRIRNGYLEMAKADPKRWLVIDATQSREEVAVIIWQKVRILFDTAEKEFSS
ncbi:MAG: dTMP kinase [Dehalococcoidia bacterium]|nr:dTMP kinase [Dehalococcoidia bacterium]